ncbi:DEAD/DEAH box helicase [Caulobacter mirabilis]|uniref:DEAD/DEAH box helicase n=1 Tax=Caulobacter mirabilis TaxID=69666 RepID=A0A2D2ATN0_9CAUL|nr:DEAD/DEAH box helicase [Caulobacter mirabilis]ATQ41327.1 DEAD/DEAH box helicase [Caulobacter mirabilis]
MAFPPLHPAIEQALVAQGYAEPTPVQRAVLEPEAEGRDLLVSAQTGSGKTVAFGVAMAPTLLGEEQYLGGDGRPAALIIAPTRELALQVSRELEWLYKQAGARIVTCVGGMDARREQRALNQGCNIVVGTPGRLRDHLERGHLDLSGLKVAVLDEADEMLDLGFREDLEFILETTPEDRRTLLFSATIARDIAQLAKTYQTDAVRIDTIARDEPHGDIEYRAIRVAPNELEHAVVNVLRAYDAGSALVFCHTRDAVRHLYAGLRERGFAVVGLSGEMGQRERNDALQALRDRHARVCVATDVAARGLDLPDLGLVVHADLPTNKATLLHRSGRTGRAGKKGTSVLLVPYTRRRKADSLLYSANIDAIWSGPPSAEEIRAGDRERMLQDPALTETPAEDDLAVARDILARHPAEQVAAALVKVFRSRLPEPEELYDPGPGQDRKRPERRERDGDFEPSEGPRDHDAFADATWFKLSIGRAKNADPKWILPLLCRIGHVTKKEIGQIRIFDRETKFQIAQGVAGRFLEAAEASEDKDVKVERSTPPTSKDFGPKKKFADREERGERPQRAPRGDRPDWKERAPRAEGDERPARPAFKDRAPRADWKDKAPRGDRPDWKDRPARAEGGDRPARPEWKDKPRGDKPAWKDKAPRPERAERPARAEKPEWKPREERPAPREERKPGRAPRDASARESVPYDPAAPKGDKPFRKPRADGGAFKAGGEYKGPKRAGGFKPDTGFKSGGPKKPFKGKPRA